MNNPVNKVDIKDDVINFFKSQEGQFVQFEEIVDFVWENNIETNRQSKYILVKNISAVMINLGESIFKKQVKSKILYKLKSI